MKQIIYTAILTLLLGSCAPSKRVAFQDDVYNNTRATKVYATANTNSTTNDDLYEDEYYMADNGQVVNNFYDCNCNGGFYNPYSMCRNNRSRFGMSVGMGWGNGFYNPYGFNNNSMWGYNAWDPYWNNGMYGWNSMYGYNSWNNPYYYGGGWNNYGWGGNPYYYGGGGQNYYQWAPNDNLMQTTGSVNAQRRTATSQHRGNPNTIGTNNPTYTRSSYNKSNSTDTKSNGSSGTTSSRTDNTVRQPLNPRSSSVINTNTTDRTYTRTNANSSVNTTRSTTNTTPSSTYRNSNTSPSRSYTPSNNTPSRSVSPSPSPSRSSSPSYSSPSRSSGSSSGSTTRSSTSRRP
jgi:hypothetical protein